MTNNNHHNITSANLTAANDVITRQLEGCYRLVTDYQNDIKRLAFATTEDEMLELADAKMGLIRTEGRIAGLIFARDEFLLRTN